METTFTPPKRKSRFPRDRRPATHPVKRCSVCGEEKPRTAEFFHRKVLSWHSACKACAKIKSPERKAYFACHQKQWRKQNPGRHREYDAAYRDRHVETLKAKRRERAFRDKKNAYQKDLRARRPDFRLRQQIGNQLVSAIGNKTNYLGATFFERFGYRPMDLKHHLERQFVGGMSWDSYGSFWEIDHITPVVLFNLPEDVKICWGLPNLRPLSKIENRKKQRKRTHLL